MASSNRGSVNAYDTFDGSEVVYCMLIIIVASQCFDLCMIQFIVKVWQNVNIQQFVNCRLSFRRLQ